MPFRIDTSGALGRAQRTPQGGFQVPATLTRSGVFTYVEGGRTIREWRPPEEVRASLASLTTATPVTYLHPVEHGRHVEVNPSNYRKFAAGNLLEAARMDEQGHVTAELALQDAEVIAAVEAGTREVSCGYTLERVDETPGRTPDGEEYDRVQRGITYNHVAIVTRGRAGSSVALRLDAHGDAIPEGPPMKFRVDGTEYSADELPQALATYEARRTQEVATLTAARDAERARADAAESEVTTLRARVTELADPKRVDEAVKARLQLVESARRVLGPDFRADGSDLEVMREVARKAFPHLKLDAEGETYIRPLFDAALASAPAPGLEVGGTLPSQGASDVRQDSADAIRAREIAAQRERELPKLAIHK